MTVVGIAADFPPGSHRVVEVDGREVGIFNLGGRLYGLANRCAHQGGPLCAGQRVTGTLIASEDTGWAREWAMEGEVIACPWHGLEYHIPTGRCLADPRISIRRYDVTLDGDAVVVTPASSRRPPAASGP